MKKFILSISCAIIFSTQALAFTCPDPHKIHFKNGKWKLPHGWILNPLPSPTTQVKQFQEVEWSAVIAGNKIGVINWCKYSTNDQPIMVNSNGISVTLNDRSHWQKVVTPKGVTLHCTMSLDACSMTPKKNDLTY